MTVAEVVGREITLAKKTARRTGL